MDLKNATELACKNKQHNIPGRSPVTWMKNAGKLLSRYTHTHTHENALDRWLRVGTQRVMDDMANVNRL